MDPRAARKLGEEVTRLRDAEQRLIEQVSDSSASDDEVQDAAENYANCVGARNRAFDYVKEPVRKADAPPPVGDQAATS